MTNITTQYRTWSPWLKTATLLPTSYSKSSELLQKFHQRQPTTSFAKDTGEMIVFKTENSPQLCRIGIHTKISSLLEDLRFELGDTFLRNAWAVITHPVKTSIFLATYRWNYTAEDQHGSGWGSSTIKGFKKDQEWRQHKSTKTWTLHQAPWV